MAVPAGRAVSHDADEYKKRNLKEGFFDHMKHWRGRPASRYDRYGTVYRGGIVLAAITDRLKHPRDTA